MVHSQVLCCWKRGRASLLRRQHDTARLDLNKFGFETVIKGRENGFNVEKLTWNQNESGRRWINTLVWEAAPRPNRKRYPSCIETSFYTEVGMMGLCSGWRFALKRSNWGRLLEKEELRAPCVEVIQALLEQYVLVARWEWTRTHYERTVLICRWQGAERPMGTRGGAKDMGARDWESTVDLWRSTTGLMQGRDSLLAIGKKEGG